MQIIIDTKMDSPEQLRKVARLLQELVGDAAQPHLQTVQQIRQSVPEAKPELFSLLSTAKEQLKEPSAKAPQKKQADDDDDGIDVQIVPY